MVGVVGEMGETGRRGDESGKRGFLFLVFSWSYCVGWIWSMLCYDPSSPPSLASRTTALSLHFTCFHQVIPVKN